MPRFDHIYDRGADLAQGQLCASRAWSSPPSRAASCGTTIAVRRALSESFVKRLRGVPCESPLQSCCSTRVPRVGANWLEIPPLPHLTCQFLVGWKWSGRRGSNPRPSPWLGGRTPRSQRCNSVTCHFVPVAATSCHGLPRRSPHGVPTLVRLCGMKRRLFGTIERLPQSVTARIAGVRAGVSTPRGRSPPRPTPVVAPRSTRTGATSPCSRTLAPG